MDSTHVRCPDHTQSRRLAASSSTVRLNSSCVDDYLITFVCVKTYNLWVIWREKWNSVRTFRPSQTGQTNIKNNWTTIRLTRVHIVRRSLLRVYRRPKMDSTHVRCPDHTQSRRLAASSSTVRLNSSCVGREWRSVYRSTICFLSVSFVSNYFAIMTCVTKLQHVSTSYSNFIAIMCIQLF